MDVVANRNEPHYKVMYAGVNRIGMVLLEALFCVASHSCVASYSRMERAFRYGDYCMGIHDKRKRGTPIDTFVTHAQKPTVVAKCSQRLSTTCLLNSVKL